MNKKLFFFTFGRSDYSSLKPIYKKFLKEKKINVALICGGSHLLKKYGLTINEIKKDKLKINFKIDYLSKNEKYLEKNKNKIFVNLINIFSNFIKKNKVKKIFIVGDRWELVPLTIAAHNNHVEIFHQSGGDYTLGSKDNLYRNLISTLSSWHFVGHNTHQKRLNNLGIENKRIFNVGETSIENFKKKNKNYEKNYVLATLYPSLFENINYKKQIEIFLNFLSSIKEEIVITGIGSEIGSDFFLNKIKKFSQKNKINFVQNAGSNYYNILMSNAKMMVGNSSSGILESSTYQLPVINIGNRQKGRLKARNVLSCDFSLKDIKKNYLKIKSARFIRNIKNIKNPYYNKNSLNLIHKEIIKILSRKQNEPQLQDSLNLK